MALTVPLVPTGMNTGVSTGPWGKCIVPVRAFVSRSFDSIVNIISILEGISKIGDFWNSYLNVCEEKLSSHYNVMKYRLLDNFSSKSILKKHF
jgi:hypothetical protein